MSDGSPMPTRHIPVTAVSDAQYGTFVVLFVCLHCVHDFTTTTPCYLHGNESFCVVVHEKRKHKIAAADRVHDFIATTPCYLHGK
jgi:hypothetical protein